MLEGKLTEPCIPSRTGPQKAQCIETDDPLRSETKNEVVVYEAPSQKNQDHKVREDDTQRSQMPSMVGVS